MQAEKYVIMSKFANTNCTGTPVTVWVDSGACLTKKQGCDKGIDLGCASFNNDPNSPIWNLLSSKYTCVAGGLNISLFMDGTCQTIATGIVAPTNSCGEGVSFFKASKNLKKIVKFF